MQLNMIRITDGRNAQLLGSRERQVKREVEPPMQTLRRDTHRHLQVGLPRELLRNALVHLRGLVIDCHLRRPDNAAYIAHGQREIRRAVSDIPHRLAVAQGRVGDIHRTHHVTVELIHRNLIEPMPLLRRLQLAGEVEVMRKAPRRARASVFDDRLHSLVVGLGGVGCDRERPDENGADDALAGGIALRNAGGCFIAIALPAGDRIADHEQRDQDDQCQTGNGEGLQRQFAGVRDCTL